MQMAHIQIGNESLVQTHQPIVHARTFLIGPGLVHIDGGCNPIAPILILDRRAHVL